MCTPLGSLSVCSACGITGERLPRRAIVLTHTLCCVAQQWCEAHVARICTLRGCALLRPRLYSHAWCRAKRRMGVPEMVVSQLAIRAHATCTGVWQARRLRVPRPWLKCRCLTWGRRQAGSSLRARRAMMPETFGARCCMSLYFEGTCAILHCQTLPKTGEPRRTFAEHCSTLTNIGDWERCLRWLRILDTGHCGALLTLGWLVRHRADRQTGVTGKVLAQRTH